MGVITSAPSRWVLHITPSASRDYKLINDIFTNMSGKTASELSPIINRTHTHVFSVTEN